MARKKQVNSIRTDYLENQIGFHRARKNYEKADMLTEIARHVGAPIDIEEVERAYHIHASWQRNNSPA